jgi:hypothetical protein
MQYLYPSKCIGIALGADWRGCNASKGKIGKRWGLGKLWVAAILFALGVWGVLRTARADYFMCSS